MRRRTAREAVQSLMTGPAPVLALRLQSSTPDCFSDLIAHCKRIKNRKQVLAEQPLLVLLFANWASPSVFSSAQMTLQPEMLGAILNTGDMDTMGGSHNACLLTQEGAAVATRGPNPQHARAE